MSNLRVIIMLYLSSNKIIIVSNVLFEFSYEMAILNINLPMAS